MKKAKRVRVVMYVLMILWAIVQLYPLFWMVLFSLKDNSEIFGGNIAGLPKKWLFSNYVQAWHDAHIAQYFVNTVIVTVATVAIVVVCSSMLAYGIVRLKWKLSGVVKNIFLMGLMIPVYSALIPLFIFFVKTKMLNTYLCLILPNAAFNLPIAVYIMCGFIEGIPKEMEESAYLDGCTPFGCFVKIISPLLRPTIATIAILTFIATWNEFIMSSIFVTKSSMKTITVGINEMCGLYTVNWGPIGAALVIAALPTLILYIIMSEQVQKSFMMGAVKG